MGTSYRPDNPFAPREPQESRDTPAGAQYRPDNPFAPKPTAPARPYGVVQAALQGATFGTADEMTAGIQAAQDKVTSLLRGERGPSWGEAYNERVKSYRRGQSDFEEARPVANTVAQVAGAVLPAVATLGASAPAVAPSLLGRAASMGRVGALQGAAAGFGSTDGDVAARIRGAGGGLVAGGVGGSAVGAAAPSLLRGMGTVANTLTGNSARNIAARAERFLAKDLKAGGVSAPQLLQEYQSGAIPATRPLAETGGTAVQNRLRDIRVLGGKGSTAVEEKMTAMRAAERPGVDADLASAFGGQAVDEVAYRKALKAAQRDEAAPLYEAAQRAAAQRFPNGIGVDAAALAEAQAVQRGMDDPIARLARQADGSDRLPDGATLDEGIARLRELPFAADAWRLAATNARARGRPLPQAFKIERVPDPDGMDGDVIERLVPQGVAPDLRSLQEWKRALRKVYKQKAQKGDIDGDIAVSVAQQIKDLDGVIGHFVPEAKVADAKYAEHARRIDAFDKGLEFLKAPKNVVRAEAGKLSQAERAEYRRAALATVDNLQDDVKDGRDALARVWQNEAVRQKYQAALSPEEYAQLAGAMEQHVARRDLYTRVMGGPNTADKLLGTSDLTGELPAGMASAGASLASGNPSPLAGWLAGRAMDARGRWVGRRTGDAIQQRAFSDTPQDVLQSLLRRSAPGAQAPARPLSLLARALGAQSGLEPAR